MRASTNPSSNVLGNLFQAQLSLAHSETLNQGASDFSVVVLELLRIYFGKFEGLEVHLLAACGSAHEKSGGTDKVTKDQWGAASLELHAAWFAHMKQLGAQSAVLYGFTPGMVTEVLGALLTPMQAVYREYINQRSAGIEGRAA